MQRNSTKRKTQAATPQPHVKSATEGLAELRQIPLSEIQTSRRPARRFLGDIASLAASMQEYGLQQPISVRNEGGKIVLTSGLRRFTAAQMLGWTTIPAFVRSVSADDAYLIDLVENLQREDLSAEEEADALRELVRTRNWTLEQVAEAVKRSPGYISKRVRLFEDAELRDAVMKRGLPLSSAELLLAAPPAQKSAMIDRAITERWDQIRVRDELMAASGSVSSAASSEKKPGAAKRSARSSSPLSIDRPPGLTRIIREFYRTILAIRAEDLTASDRSALRSVYRALVMLGRAPTTARPPVFPPLPATRAHQGRSTSSGRTRPNKQGKRSRAS